MEDTAKAFAATTVRSENSASESLPTAAAPMVCPPETRYRQETEISPDGQEPLDPPPADNAAAATELKEESMQLPEARTAGQEDAGALKETDEESEERIELRIIEERAKLQLLLDERIRKENALAKQKEAEEEQGKISKIIARFAKEGIDIKPEDIARGIGVPKSKQLHIDMNSRDLDKCILEFKKYLDRQSIEEQEAAELELAKNKEKEAVQFVVRNVMAASIVALLLFFWFILKG